MNEKTEGGTEGLILHSSIQKHQKHKESPFMEELLKIKTRGKTVTWGKKAIPLANTDTGEIEEIGFLSIKQEVDGEAFVKIFKAELQSLFDLSKRAMKLISYFMQAARINQDKVFFDRDECRKFTGYVSKITIQFALTELLEKKFIARTDNPSMYYINPMTFFNGNRMVVVREYLRKSTKEMKDQKQYDLLTGQTNAEMTKQLQSGINTNLSSENNMNSNPNN